MNKFFTIFSLVLLFCASCKKTEVQIPPKQYDFTPIEGVYIFEHTFMYRSYVHEDAPLHIENRLPDTFAVALMSSQQVQINYIPVLFCESQSEDSTKYFFTDNEQPAYYSIYHTCEWFPANDSISFIRYEREPNGLHVDAWTGVWSPL